MDLDDWQVTGDVHLVDRIPWLDFATAMRNRFISVSNASVRFVGVAEPLECEFLSSTARASARCTRWSDGMRTYRAALLIIGIGLLTFGAMFTLLQVTRSEAAPSQSAAALALPADNALAVSSFALRMAPGEIAVGLPSCGSEPVLRTLQPGARIDVLASLPSRGRRCVR